MNEQERKVRSRIQWVLNKRNTLGDRLFDDGKSPLSDVWKKVVQVLEHYRSFQVGNKAYSLGGTAGNLLDFGEVRNQ